LQLLNVLNGCAGFDGVDWFLEGVVVNSVYRNFAILGASAVAILCFQNCSNVSFSAVEQGSVSKIGLVNEDGVEEAPPTNEELLSLCQSLQANQKSLAPIADGGQVADMYGNSLFKASGNVAALTHIYGNIRVLGLQAGTTIGKIDASSGNILVCGMNVGQIVNGTHGNLYVVNGNVGDVNNFNGSLRLVGGQITGTVTNSNGNIARN
jgi:hypothetical protein